MTETIPSASYLLEVSGVSKSFPGVKALSNMHLTLRHNECLALVGENGAGKSTLMKLLSGVYHPDEGSFRLDGEPIQVTGPKHAQQLGISIIHQEFNLMDDLTVAQNIFIGREPTRGGFLSERALTAQANELFERIGISLDPRAVVGSLTVAKQQMVEIAKSLSFSSRVLIMDEPTAALNDREVEALFAIIENFRSPDTGVIYISHRMEELKQISQRISVIRDGEYVDTVDTAETSMRQVISLMVGRAIDANARPQPGERSDDVVLQVEGLATASLLRDVSFELHRGEILGFAGLMGAGRTEVARAIVGADPLSSGTIRVQGQPVSIPNPAVAARLGIGYLSEDRKALGLLLEQSVADNIVLSSLSRFSRAGVADDRAIKRQARDQCDRLRVKTPSVEQLAQFLSGGNQQKVVIAKWLTKDCDVLIFDEPTRGIDVGAKEEIYALLQELAENGKAIIMISSELPEVLRLSHRIVVMSGGRITAVMDNADADQESIMEHATQSAVQEHNR